MKLHFLKYFCVLAEELHFHRAADRLAISQPPLSAAIKSLEEELGVKLLRRNSKMVALTSAGVAFAAEAREILERVSRAGDLVRALDRGMRGRLDIGLSGSLLYREVPPIVAHFHAELPAVDVVLHELSTTEQIERLSRRKLDAGFLHGSTLPPQLHSLALATDDFVLCLPEGHPLAARKAADLRAVEHERFVMFSRDAAPSNHDNVVAVFSAAGIHPRTVHMARTWMTIIAVVSQFGGVAVVPKSLARAGIHGVRFVPLRDGAGSAPAMLAWNPDFLSNEMTKFLECAAQIIKPPASRTKLPAVRDHEAGAAAARRRRRAR